MTTRNRIHPFLRVPPPLVFVLSFLAGAGLQSLVPLHAPSAALLRDGRIVGIALIGCGVLLALSCVGLFLLSRTTVIPWSTASTLVTRGPYRLTRNPMYLSLVLAYTGVALALFDPWPLVLLPLPVLLMHTIVIPFEEARMREAFGEAYDLYCAKVRRWL